MKKPRDPFRLTKPTAPELLEKIRQRELEKQSIGTKSRGYSPKPAGIQGLIFGGEEYVGGMQRCTTCAHARVDANPSKRIPGFVFCGEAPEVKAGGYGWQYRSRLAVCQFNPSRWIPNPGGGADIGPTKTEHGRGVASEDQGGGAT